MKFLRPRKIPSTPIAQATPLYAEEADWRYQTYQSQTVWLNRALVGLMVLSVLLLMSLIANLFLFPLKSNTPYLYTVNENTGELTQIGQFGNANAHNCIKPGRSASANWCETM